MAHMNFVSTCIQNTSLKSLPLVTTIKYILYIYIYKTMVVKDVMMMMILILCCVKYYNFMLAK